MNDPKEYGVYFEQSRYIQFTGSTYDSFDPTNIITTLSFPLEFANIQLMDAQVVFASGSGEIKTYNENSKSFIIQDSVNLDQRYIEFNSLGVPVIQE
jgi:hypothetical protein